MKHSNPLLVRLFALVALLPTLALAAENAAKATKE
jgi:hypothetical protein